MKLTKYETNLSKFRLLKETNMTKSFSDLKNQEKNLLILYPDIQYQKIIGFGGAFTEAAGYCFSQLPEEQKKQFMEDYFSKNGLNYSLCRTHIGSCDFCFDTYSYSNNESLSDFSIERDTKYIIPMIKKALAIKSNMELVSTPWSPPAFMKDTKQLKKGGKILDKYKSLWADYLVKYIQEYKKQGITINYMTIQNEPNAAQPWESCTYTAKDEKDIIKNYISPTFQANNISTKLLIWDHNKERILYRANEIFDDFDCKNLITGIGYHYYSGDYFENIQLFNQLYNDKLIIHTEGCTGYEKIWFRKKQRRIPNAEIYAHDIIGDLNSGSNGYIDWNLMLDYHGGPTHINNSCNAPIMLNKKSNMYTKTLTYYYIGHFSRFIQPGAKRIAFSKFTNKLEITSFINPDSSIATVILNPNKSSQKINLCINSKIYPDTILIDGHSIITLILNDV